MGEHGSKLEVRILDSGVVSVTLHVAYQDGFIYHATADKKPEQDIQEVVKMLQNVADVHHISHMALWKGEAVPLFE